MHAFYSLHRSSIVALVIKETDMCNENSLRNSADAVSSLLLKVYNRLFLESATVYKSPRHEQRRKYFDCQVVGL